MYETKSQFVEFCQSLWNSNKVSTINIVVLSALVIGHLTIPAVSIDINCNRLSNGIVDCELVRSTILFSKKPFKIEDVRAADIYTYGSPDSSKTYLTELISAENRNRTFLLFFLKHKVARQTVHTLNEFLRDNEKQTLFYRASNVWGNFSIRHLTQQKSQTKFFEAITPHGQPAR